MGLTSAMLVGLTGIKSNQYTIDTVGDNVANVNTTAFKNQRALFETNFYRTIAEGTAPNDLQGGTNPRQIGFGSSLAAIQRNFEQGSIQGTGVKSDVAVDGDGFFILQTAANTQIYTRDGAFGLDEDNTLVSAEGHLVQGFAADDAGQIVAGTLSNLVIPLGNDSEARVTTVAVMEGNLDAASTPAAVGAVSQTAALQTAGGAATTGSALTALVDSDGAPLFADGDVVTIRNVQKGGGDMPDAQFVVGVDGNTLGDLASYLESVLAIDTTISAGGQTAGVTVDATGALVITSNPGEANAVNVEASNIRNDTSGILPFAFTSTPAVGDGVTTALSVFDSLGNPLEVRLRFALESQDQSGTVWRFFAESTGDSDVSPLLGTGTLSFDQNGQLVASSGTDVTVDRVNNGSASPLNFTLDFSDVTGLNFGDAASSVRMATQDGTPGATLIDYGIDQDGVIVGTFSNGATRVYGQLALARFQNNEGLNAQGDNAFQVGVNSGDAQITTAGLDGAGTLQSGALEQSNVDLSREFVNLITASTGFTAASRVVRSADDLLQELLLLAR